MNAIVAPGGGLRCAFTAGVLHALAEKVGGISDVFDRAYSSSGGGFVLVYHFAQQADLIQAAICAPETPWRQVLSLRNLMRGKPLLNLQYLLSEMQRRGLQAEKAAQTGKLIFVATDVKQATPVYLNVSDSTLVWKHMMATAAVPFLQPAVFIDGIWLADGMLSDPVPIERALDNGCRKVVVIDSRPQQGTSWALNQLAKWLCGIAPRPKNYDHSVQKLLDNAQRMVEVAERRIASCPNVIVIRPSKVSYGATHYSMPEKMCQLFQEGVEDAHLFLREHPNFL